MRTLPICVLLGIIGTGICWAVAPKPGESPSGPSALGVASEGIATTDPAPSAPPPRALFLIRDQGGCGFIDTTGAVVIDPQFYNAEPFSEGLAPICIPWISTPGKLVDGKWEPGKSEPEKWGYIDTSGKIVITPQFSKAWCFSEGLALVGVQVPYGGGTTTNYGYIDRTGKTVIKPQFSVAHHFSEGLAAAMLPTGEGRYGFINKQGKFTIAPQFKSFTLDTILKRKTISYYPEPPYNNKGAFHEGLAQVGPVTFIDKSGRMAVNFKNNGAEIRSGYVDYRYGYMRTYSEGLAAIIRETPEGWGYVDKSGTLVIKYQFLEAWDFNDGLAAVSVSLDGGKRGKYGYINRAGKMIVKPQFDNAGDFSEGLAHVSTEDGLSGYIDKTGKVVLQMPAGFWPFPDQRPRSSDIPFRNGLAGGVMGYIDKTGRIIWKAGSKRVPEK